MKSIELLIKYGVRPPREFKTTSYVAEIALGRDQIQASLVNGEIKINDLRF